MHLTLKTLHEYTNSVTFLSAGVIHPSLTPAYLFVRVENKT